MAFVGVFRGRKMRAMTPAYYNQRCDVAFVFAGSVGVDHWEHHLRLTFALRNPSLSSKMHDRWLFPVLCT